MPTQEQIDRIIEEAALETEEMEVMTHGTAYDQKLSGVEIIHFWPGKPSPKCKDGHISKQYVNDGKCFVCYKIASMERNEEQKAKDKEIKRILKKAAEAGIK